MIALNSDCLMFRLSNGESIPCSAEMICIEVVSQSSTLVDPELLRHATASVFHYFKYDLECQTVTVGEFAGALEKVLRNLGLAIRGDSVEREVLESDLGLLARECDGSLELFFFQRLRREMRLHLLQSPRLLRFRGLRRCVKQLAGARRWSARCEKLREQIVEFLRQCLTAEQNECAIIVE